jgi:hypothetical protein
MCIIFACEQKWPSKDEILAGADANPHGGGIAWINDETKKVEWIKGLRDGKDALDVIASGVVKQFPAVIHYRIKTVGEAIPELTHPFPLTPAVPLTLKGNAPAVLFHNGNWNGWRDFLVPALAAGGAAWPKGPWSDTRALAWFLARGGSEALDMLYEGANGLKPDRVLVMDGKEGCALSALTYRGTWHEKDGFRASNDHYDSRKTKSYTTTVWQSGFHGGNDHSDRSGFRSSITGSGTDTRAGDLGPPKLYLPPAEVVDLATVGSSGSMIGIGQDPLQLVLVELRKVKQLRAAALVGTSH